MFSQIHSVCLHILGFSKSESILASKCINNHCNNLCYCDISYDNSLAACLHYTLMPVAKVFGMLLQEVEAIHTL